jgi:ankyrin repeat protein
VDVFTAIEAGDEAALRRLVEEDPSAIAARNAEGLSPTLRALYLGRQELLEVLLGLEPELDVFEAVAVGDEPCVRELVDSDPALVNAWAPDGFTPLQLASFFGHPAIVRSLLERGADVHAVSRNEMSVQPLHAACAGPSALEIARMLLDAGADPNARQQDDFTPLMAAQQRNDAELEALLGERGADA